MKFDLDHLVVAGRNINTLRDAFAKVGLEPEYGGKHGNGITHNYILGFPDRSYIELISKIASGSTSPWWDIEIRQTSGPAAWALFTEDIDRETERLADLGFMIGGPTEYTRNRPDGRCIEWELTVIGERIGCPFPFLIEDHTPRKRRIPISDSVQSTPLIGISEIVLGVSDLDEWIEPFSDLFDTTVSERAMITNLDAEAVTFTDAPVTLCAPQTDSGWLAHRVRRFETRPIGCVLRRDGSSEWPRNKLHDSVDWFGDELQCISIDIPGWFAMLSKSA